MATLFDNKVVGMGFGLSMRKGQLSSSLIVGGGSPPPPTGTTGQAIGLLLALTRAS